MLPWLLNPPENNTYSHTLIPVNGTFWNRDDVSSDLLYTLFTGDNGNFHPLLDSFMFTSGYSADWIYWEYQSLGKTSVYRMDTAITLACTASFFMFFMIVVIKMNTNYRSTNVDSYVQKELAQKGKKEKVLIDTDQIFGISLFGGSHYFLS